MEELDGDEVRVSSRGCLAERDIVQVLIVIGLLTFRIWKYTKGSASYRLRTLFLHSTRQSEDYQSFCEYLFSIMQFCQAQIEKQYVKKID